MLPSVLDQQPMRQPDQVLRLKEMPNLIAVSASRRLSIGLLLLNAI